MRKIKKITLYLVIVSFLQSCGDIGKTLRNEKIKTTDEFLVEKRKPLSLPPDYENLPEPRSGSQEKESNNDQINKILRMDKKQTSKKGSTTVEQSIINQIRK